MGRPPYGLRPPARTLFAWDLNGTLEQGSERADAAAMNALFSELELDVRVTPGDMANAPPAWTDRLRMFAPTVKVTDEHIDRLVKMRERRSVECATEFPTAKEALAKVKRHGDDNIVISLLGTNCLQDTIRKIGIERYVDSAYSTRDDYFRKRPDGSYRTFLKLIAEFKAHLIQNHARNKPYARKMMAGDRPEDIEAGRLSGATTFQIGKNCTTAADYKVMYPMDVVRIAYGRR